MEAAEVRPTISLLINALTPNYSNNRIPISLLRQRWNTPSPIRRSPVFFPSFCNIHTNNDGDNFHSAQSRSDLNNLICR